MLPPTNSFESFSKKLPDHGRLPILGGMAAFKRAINVRIPFLAALIFNAVAGFWLYRLRFVAATVHFEKIIARLIPRCYRHNVVRFSM